VTSSWSLVHQLSKDAWSNTHKKFDNHLQIRTDYTEKLLLLMDKSKADMKINKNLLNTYPLAKGFCAWFHMGC